MPFPDLRVASTNDRPVNPGGAFVLYWMIASRRATSNFALDRAVELAARLHKPLVVLEALRVRYPWASARFHAFVLQGMHDNARAFARRPVHYYPYAEASDGDGKGLVTALSQRAAAVVTDAFPAFFLARMAAAAQSRSPVLFEQVDSLGLVPLRATERPYFSAFSFESFLQKQLLRYLEAFPSSDPFKGLVLPRLESLPPDIRARWPPLPELTLKEPDEWMSSLRIDHRVAPVPETEGGHATACATLNRFLDESLDHYANGRHQPERPASSGLSPYLHFGHLSTHEIFDAVMTRERWTSRAIAPGPSRGQREGWWGVSKGAEAFLDELITWRELGHVTAHHCRDHDAYESLPAWARATLERHATDERTHLYACEQFESAATHDPLWNAAQVQLLREGRIHNYLRMLWGKKILEWSASPREALATMIELNNKYALDGRDPNSYSGISWVLGRYDRPWAPERPVFGTVRYMSSENTARKLRVREYVKEYSS